MAICKKALTVLAKVACFLLVWFISFFATLLLLSLFSGEEISTIGSLVLLIFPIAIGYASISPKLWNRPPKSKNKLSKGQTTKKNKICPEDQAVIDGFKKMLSDMQSNPPKPLSAEEYAEIRNKERQWLECNYDFSTVESINSIPVQKNLPRPPGNSPTGDVYYYLRYKARLYEESGDIELAIACMRKSIDLMQEKYGSTHGREECYSYVRMLARNGYTEAANIEKQKADSYYRDDLDNLMLANFQTVCRHARELGTDLLIMNTLGSTCPECAKFQGRVYSLSGKSKIFPPLPETVKETGGVHAGCHHQFFSYTHNVSRVDMNHTLILHPLQNKAYGRDIITFSNRPFVDDRTEECKRRSEVAREQKYIQKLNKQRYDDLIIERETAKRNDYQDYDWLKAHFPDKCPASPSGYRRMKTQNTKNYQALKQMAAKLGREI